MGAHDTDEDLRRAWELAGRQDLTDEQVRELLRDPREPVLVSLAQNPALAPDAVQALVDRGGEIGEWASRNPHASLAVKDSLPVREQSAYSLELYLQAREATEAQVKAVSIALNEHSSELLGVLWRRIEQRYPR